MEGAGRDWGRGIQSRVLGLPCSTWSTSHPYPHSHLYLLLVSPYFIAQLWHSHAQLECALFPVLPLAAAAAAPLVVVVLLSPLTLHATVHFVFTAIFFLVVHN